MMLVQVCVRTLAHYICYISIDVIAIYISSVYCFCFIPKHIITSLLSYSVEQKLYSVAVWNRNFQSALIPLLSYSVEQKLSISTYTFTQYSMEQKLSINTYTFTQLLYVTETFNQL